MSPTGPQSDSFEELAMPLFDQLYNFARWMTRNTEEAEDLVQETYVKALKGFPSFQLGTNFRAWMYRILRNTFLTSRTGLRATMTVPLDPEQDEPELAVENETPETILMKRSDSQQVIVPSMVCRCITGKPFFSVRWRKCRTKRLPRLFPFLSAR